MAPKVIAVIPIHNGREETLAFLDSIACVTYTDLKVVVVDDGSTDDSAEAIKNIFPQVAIIKGDGHLWWSGATNAGVKWALANGAEFILAINNDNVVTPRFLEHLIDTALANPRSLVTSKMFDYDDHTFTCSFGGKIDWLLGEIRDYTNWRDRCNFEKALDCDWLHGSATVIPAAAFLELGLFDNENCPQYHGDAEFTLRAKRSGYRLIVEPQSIVYHRTKISAGTRSLNSDNITSLVKDICSPFYFKANYKIYRDYCPYRPYHLFLVVRYVRLLYSLFRRRFIDKTRI
ncbi:MAG: glycosyltransferase family 2 protein [Desulfuromonadales bacterium]